MSGFTWKGRTALITGVSGFIGAWLAEALVESGAHVIGFDMDPAGALPLHTGLSTRIEVVTGSVTSLHDVSALFETYRPDTCFHLAGASMIDRSIAAPATTFEVNAMGTWVVLEAARLAPVRPRVVAASSNHVYGSHEAFPYGEEYALNGSTPYAASKACADVIARSYASTYGMPIVIARLTNTYGGADPHTTHLVTATIQSVLRGESPVIHSDGSPLKSYLYVSDTLNGLMRMAEHADRPSVNGEPFNLCTDSPIQVIDLVRAVIDAVGAEGVHVRVLGKPGEFHEREFLSNARAKAILGWSPEYTLEQGLRKTIAWYRDHPEVWNRTSAVEAP